MWFLLENGRGWGAEPLASGASKNIMLYTLKLQFIKQDSFFFKR
jgi:hypothetical protein